MARTDKRKTKEEKFKINFLVEGPTEKYYFTDFLKDISYKIKIDIKSVNGGGYRDFKNDIDKNKHIYDIIIVIADMDRLEKLPHEKERLQELIKLLNRENLKNNIFLTNKNIEDWIKSTLKEKVVSLEGYLGYSGGSKGKEDIYKRLCDKDSSFEKAQTCFKERDLYYLKKDFEKGKIEEGNINKKQSNLIYFIEYLKKLKTIN
ncbi:hypothetical protein H5J22_00830 [Cetobacterium sp. 8H]|uniref:hypothetical protein n=1 Tax=Cetobacterium sp. 8H TaxID=2759681 RepID=UPI00163C4B81|nr:hypothetical protein [Cetobacterium sp. 8H]MBC2850005.1 hypothetical protein [Cetobacterium sp. 8H]